MSKLSVMPNAFSVLPIKSAMAVVQAASRQQIECTQFSVLNSNQCLALDHGKVRCSLGLLAGSVVKPSGMSVEACRLYGSCHICEIGHVQVNRRMSVSLTGLLLIY